MRRTWEWVSAGLGWGVVVWLLLTSLACTEELVLSVNQCTWTLRRGEPLVLFYEDVEPCADWKIRLELEG